MAGAILIGRKKKDNLCDHELGMGESMSSTYALCFGDTIISVLEKRFCEVIPEITFIYEFGDTIDFSALDKKSFNKTMKILKDYFDHYQNTKDDNTAEDIAKHIWLRQVYPYVQQDERYSSNELGES